MSYLFRYVTGMSVSFQDYSLCALVFTFYEGEWFYEYQCIKNE